MGLNRARVLHEAIQLAIKGQKVIMSCPDLGTSEQMAKQLLEGVATNWLLYDEPKYCTHESSGPGWAARFRNQGEVFFSCFFSEDDRYFDTLFTLVPVEEIRAEIVAKGMFPIDIPLEWHSGTSLVRDPIYVPSRYERIMANCRG
jgi:hypothetical protein